MARTSEIIAKQKEHLFSKHPDLHQLSVLEVRHAPFSYEEISAFIEVCWRQDYTNEARLVFSPSFLAFNQSKGKPADRSLLAVTKSENEIQGFFCIIPLCFAKENVLQSASLVTGLSCRSNHRGSGISQYLVLETEERIVKNNEEYGLFWLDQRHQQQGGSFQVYGKDRMKTDWGCSVSLYAKTYDYPKALKSVVLSRLEKLGLRINLALFPPNRSVKAPLDIQLFQRSDIRETLEFLSEFQKQCSLHRVFSEAELLHRFLFSQDDVHGIALLMRKAGRLRGLFFGFTNPVGTKGTCYAQIDGLVFHPDLTYAEKRRLLASCEAEILERWGCFSAVVPETVTTENLLKYGYIPFVNQTLGANFYTDTVSPEDIKNSFVELR